jgi:hypothetical protein
VFADTKVSLSGDFMSLFPTHPDFGNSTEEFHPHAQLGACIGAKLSFLSFLSSTSALAWL